MSAHAIVSKLVEGAFAEEAIELAARSAREEAGGGFHAVIAFVPSSWKQHVSDLCEVLQIHARCPRVFGCSADGVIRDGQEIEGGEACSLLFLRLEETEIGPAVGDPGPQDSYLALVHPFQPVEDVLEEWRHAVPGMPVYGGLASGGRVEEDIFLFDQTGILEEESLLIRLRGRVGIRGAVSQGCRPIGEPMTITGVEGNVIESLANQNVCDLLEEAYAELSEEEREGAGGNILVGIAMSEYKEDFEKGDFLISSILAGDPQSGSIAIAAEPEVGQTLQFQLRDRDSAHDEMRAVCRAVVNKEGMRDQLLGGLLFTCTGRGSQLFGEAGHDAGVIRAQVGPMPLAGFFCNGEIAPVGGQNYLHAFTASMAFLVDKGK
jgi:small ligand-binding sensory domain FIST